MKEYVEKILHYTAGNLLQKIILLVLLPVFTHFLAPQEYAVYTNIVVFISFASLLYFLGFQQTLFSYFYQEKTPEYHFTLISSIFIVIIAFGIVLSILIIGFRVELSQIILRTKDFAHIMLWVSVILFFDVIYGMVLSILNMMELSKQYILVGNFKHVLFFVLLVVAAIASKFSLDTIFINDTGHICNAHPESIRPIYADISFYAFLIRCRNLCNWVSGRNDYNFSKLDCESRVFPLCNESC